MFYFFKDLTEKQIIANSIMFSIAGYQTSMTTISHLIHILATNQIIQQKLIKEVDQTFDDQKLNNKIKCDFKDNKETKINDKRVEEVEEEGEEEKENIIDKINGMPFLDSCVKESLRLCPPVSTLRLKVTKDCKLENVLIPKNSQIIIPIYAIHRDPDNYDNPNKFKPERFLPQYISQITNGSYLPFGDGPEYCTGITIALLEIKLSIVNILKNFRFAKCGQTKVVIILSNFPIFLCFTYNFQFIYFI